MKKTNKELYEIDLNFINTHINNIINKYYGNGLPPNFYSVSPNGTIIEHIITHATIHHKFYIKDKITKIDVKEINDFRLNMPDYKKSDISLNYYYYSGSDNQWKTSSAIKESNIISPQYFFEKNDALAKSEEIKDKIIIENKQLATGNYIKCDRCRKVVPKIQSKTSTIIGRGIDRFGKSCITKQSMVFCSSECAVHEQYSREG